MNTRIANLIVRKSLELLNRYDAEIIDRKLKEECINHRFAFYLERYFRKICPNENHISIDLEYSKNMELDKQYNDENGIPITFRPDIIIHERNSNEFNYIAIESKKEYLTKKDKNSLEGMLRPVYAYDNVYGISYLPGKSYFRITSFQLQDNVISSNVERYAKR